MANISSIKNQCFVDEGPFHDQVREMQNLTAEAKKRILKEVDEHQLINRYIHGYKDMLSVNHYDAMDLYRKRKEDKKNKAKTSLSIKEPFILTVDFEEYNKVKLADKGID